MTLRRRGIRLAMAFTVAATVPAHAAEPWWAERALTVEAGAFIGEFDTRVRLHGPSVGDWVNLEDSLGLDSDQTTFRGELCWRFAPRHRVSVGYYEFDRHSDASAGRSFVIETEGQQLRFDAGIDLSTEFDWRLAPIIYTYSFILTDRTEVAASIGAHWLDAKVGYSGSAHVNGNPVSEGAGESETASAPLPVLGLEAAFAATPRLRVGARAQYFGLDYGDYSGRLTDVRLQAEFQAIRWLGIGLAYTWYDIDFSRDDGEFEASLDFDYAGPGAFLTLSF